MHKRIWKLTSRTAVARCAWRPAAWRPAGRVHSLLPQLPQLRPYSPAGAGVGAVAIGLTVVLLRAAHLAHRVGAGRHPPCPAGVDGQPAPIMSSGRASICKQLHLAIRGGMGLERVSRSSGLARGRPLARRAAPGPRRRPRRGADGPGAAVILLPRAPCPPRVRRWSQPTRKATRSLVARRSWPACAATVKPKPSTTEPSSRAKARRSSSVASCRRKSSSCSAWMSRRRASRGPTCLTRARLGPRARSARVADAQDGHELWITPTAPNCCLRRRGAHEPGRREALNRKPAPHA
jgi:hypothetical protein